MLNALRQPLRFEPFYRPMVWGGRSIARFLGKNLPSLEPFGESWEVSDHAGHRSRLATASLFGITLRQLMEAHPRELLGPAAGQYSVFPWLFKLLDAQEQISVQVHPDEAAVKIHWPGENAKTEAWYVLDAKPESRIYAGLQANVRRDDFREALEDGTVVDCLHSFRPSVGDFVFIPAGTVHALGGGLLLAEIQQTSDATFRLFDWNRRDAQGKPRALHVEKGLASIHWDQGPIQPIAASDAHRSLVKCPYFEIERLEAKALISVGGQQRLQAWIIAAGHGRFDNGEYALPGDVWIFPASMPALNFRPDKPIAGLLCTLP